VIILSIRIIFFTSESHPTYRSDVRVLFGKYLPRYSIKTDLVALKDHNSETKSHWGGGNLFLTEPTKYIALNRVKMFFHALRVMCSVNSKDYDAIQVRDMPILAFFLLIMSKFKKMEFYYWMSYPISEGWIDLAKRRGFSAGYMRFFYPWLNGRLGKFFLYRFVLPRSSHIFVQSENMKRNLSILGIEKVNMTPVPMGVDMESVRSIEKNEVMNEKIPNRKILLYLGSFDRTRHVELLFEMLVILKSKFSDIVLMLVGDAYDDIHRNWLKNQAEELGVSGDVQWTGWLPLEEAWKLVRRADIGLSPVPRGFLLDASSPTKILEYYALRLPVVCNDSPEQDQLVKKSGSGICVNYTPQEFADSVSDMLSKSDSELNEILMRGRKYVEKYRSYSCISEMLSKKYKEISKAM